MKQTRLNLKFIIGNEFPPVHINNVCKAWANLYYLPRICPRLYESQWLSNVKETKYSEEIQSFQKLRLQRIFKSAKYHRSLNLTSLFYREEKKKKEPERESSPEESQTYLGQNLPQVTRFPGQWSNHTVSWSEIFMGKKWSYLFSTYKLRIAFYFKLWYLIASNVLTIIWSLGSSYSNEKILLLHRVHE